MKSSFPLRLIPCFAALMTAVPGMSQQPPASPAPPVTAPETADRTRLLVDAQPGEDISERLQDAFDKARSAGGGTVLLPPGNYSLSRMICLAGRLEKFPKGGVSGLTLDGNGATLIWNGPDEEAMLDLPGAAFCTIKNLRIQGQRERYWGKVAAIRYRGGIERGSHGGKNNLFQQIDIQNVGIGFDVGGLFGPDLVGGTFMNCATLNLRIGYRFAGGNVTSMVIINPLVAGFEEAGFKIVGFTARKIRESAGDPIPPAEVPGAPSVLMDLENEKELFQKDLPAWMTAADVSYPTFRKKEADGKSTLWAGGGSLEVTIFGLLGHSKFLNSWMVDTNWGNVRIYSARIEGMGGILRQSSEMPDSFGVGHYSTLFEDVNATTLGGITGNAIEIRNRTPLYLIGGSYRANIAAGDRTTIYTMGTRFQTAPRSYPSFMPLNYDKDLGERFKATGKINVLGHLRGKGELWQVSPVDKPGFVPLPRTKGAALYELSRESRLTLKIPAGATEVEAILEGGSAQPDANYQITATPGFDAGSVWYEKKENDSVIIRFERAPEKESSIDITIGRDSSHDYGKAS